MFLTMLLLVDPRPDVKLCVLTLAPHVIPDSCFSTLHPPSRFFIRTTHLPTCGPNACSAHPWPQIQLTDSCLSSKRYHSLQDAFPMPQLRGKCSCSGFPVPLSLLHGMQWSSSVPSAHLSPGAVTMADTVVLTFGSLICSCSSPCFPLAHNKMFEEFSL